MTGRSRILIVRPSAGGVAHVASKTVAELRRQGQQVRDVALRESSAPAWRGMWSAVGMLRQIRRAGTVHIELGRTTAAPFWFAVVATSLRSDVVIVAHDAPILVDAPGAAVVPVGPGWRDAVAYKIVAPLLNRPITAYVRRKAGAFAVLSNAAAHRCAEIGIERVGLVSHGADAPVAAPPPSAAGTVVFGGFLSPGKGVDDLVAAWREVGATTDLRLIIAGEVSRQHADWLAQVKASCSTVSNPPCWIGYLDDEHFNDLIAAAAVVVLPYRASNPISGILVRAMVQGRAIVATRVPAMESLIEDGVTGRLVGVRDTTALAGAIRELIRDPRERDRLGANAARVAAGRHTWERQVDDLGRVYAVTGGPK